MAALYSERKEEIPEVKTISAGELPGMRAAKPAGELDGLLLGVRAKALLLFFLFCLSRRERVSDGGRRRFGHALFFF